MKGYAATQVLCLVLISAGVTLRYLPVLFSGIYTQGLLTSDTSLWKSPPFSKVAAMQSHPLHCPEVTRAGGKKPDHSPKVLLLKGLGEPTLTLQGKPQAILIFSALFSSPYHIGIPSRGSRQGSAKANVRDHSQ